MSGLFLVPYAETQQAASPSVDQLIGGSIEWVQQRAWSKRSILRLYQSELRFQVLPFDNLNARRRREVKKFRLHRHILLHVAELELGG